ncbi:MAG TPA: SHOCT domain-containing protein [Acidimicrobiales bacterium]|nr:SHOCT domain-containing protein [Acidimicrobiales bacterium]
MVIADVGLGDLLWTALWVFMLVLVVWVFIAIISDLFRDHQTSGWVKAAWVVALIVFPLLGSLAYLIVRGQGMAERSAAEHRIAQQQMDSYIRSTAASTGTGPVDDLTRLAQLRENGTITDAEFETIKARVVSGAAPAS